MCANCTGWAHSRSVGVNFRNGVFRWPRIEKMSAAQFMIHIELQNQTVPQNIRVAWTWCHFGGSRPWLIVLAEGGWRGCSREWAAIIAEPAAATRSMRASAGARRRGPTAGLSASAAARRLASGIDPVPARPYRMRRKTYARLCERIRRLERPLVGSRVLRHAPLWFLPLSY